MSSSRFVRLFHTVRYLKVRQVYGRLYYRLLRGRVRRQAMKPLGEACRRAWQEPWSAPSWMPPCLLKNDEFRFLGERGSVAAAQDWNHPQKSKLWLYNLHYLDDLNAQGAEHRFSAHRRLVERWIAENPPLNGNGWEPYTLSLRLVNLIKWLNGPGWLGNGSIPHVWLESLARQAQALFAQRETHILANHLFANGKALTFAGAFLGGAAGDRWLAQGLAILDEEVPEQFLADGGHFERSPMYHATLMWDLCDLLNLAACTELPQLQARLGAWRKRLAQGLDWLATMVHPDGDIGFFNDATLGIAPTLTDLQRYATRLGVSAPEPSPLLRSESAPFVVQHARPSGYMAVSWGDGCKALLDMAPLGPDYQPGHAHADTLSFELSLFGRRVLVNSGISQYGEDAERQRQRSTAAHNTVVVDGENSSEVWAGFRVARRARPSEVRTATGSNALSVQASHDGYRRLPGKVEHRREWRFGEHALSLLDTLEGRFQRAEARFHCHPEAQLELDGPCQGWITLGEGQHVAFAVEGGRARIETTTWHSGFGESQTNQCLVIEIDGAPCRTTFTWA